jgi:predicted ATPase
VLSYDAIHLFVQSARLVKPEFSLTRFNVSATVRISQLTEGIPLALEITAAWVRLMDVEQIAQTIAGSSDFLASPVQDLPDRHRSMRAVFDYSWNLLSPAEQLTLAKTAIFQNRLRWPQPKPS